MDTDEGPRTSIKDAPDTNGDASDTLPRQENVTGESFGRKLKQKKKSDPTTQHNEYESHTAENSINLYADDSFAVRTSCASNDYYKAALFTWRQENVN
ncbi:unnamed protein product [Clonostachys rosea f. rosea IK726]|uniref:Uncharacterized protein n=1 Tax=Clonostachys rosea f. rosea IK726 TaxID=1349383 RepID=A0ACA9TZT9_BIOOC|nr:unnamed protein product [Clonostachys rosea f. rosea IK726]